MNINEYIQSGIIESYVLGLADAEEAAELKQLRAQYPELELAIQTFESELEAASFRNAVQVAPHVKTELLSKLDFKANDGESTVIPTISAELKPKGKTAFMKYMAAASVALLICSAGLNIYTYSKYKKLVAENRQLALQRDQLYASNTITQTKLSEADRTMQLITGSDMLKVELTGVPGKEANKAIVYWSQKDRDVYLITKNLPEAPKGKQYQLWALVDGKPVDAGMLSNCQSICKLKNIQSAQAFAITLEKEGGSPTPNLEQLYVMGKI